MNEEICLRKEESNIGEEDEAEKRKLLNLELAKVSM